MSIRDLERAREAVTWVAQVSLSAGSGVFVPTQQWHDLLRVIDAVVAEDKENRR